MKLASTVLWSLAMSAALIAAADVTVRGTVVGTSPHAIPLLDSDQTRPATSVRLKLSEVLTTNGLHPLASDDITIVRKGGERDRGSYIEQTIQDGFPALESSPVN
jgi:hypothetical protein